MRIEDMRLDMNQLMHQQPRQGSPHIKAMPLVLESESMAWTRGGTHSAESPVKAAYAMQQGSPTVHTPAVDNVAPLTDEDRSPSTPSCLQSSSEQVRSVSYRSHDLLLN